MIWKQCIFQTKTEGAADALGNPTVSWTNGLTTEARFTPWTDEQIALVGRDVTRNQQRFAVRAPYSSVKDYERVKIDDVVYEITEPEDLGPRFTVIQVKVYKK